MRNISFILIALSAVLALSCSTSSDGSDSVELVPLQIGNQWVIEVPRGSSSYIDTVKVMTDSLIDGKIWYQLECEFPCFVIAEQFNGLYRNSKDGLHQYVSDANGGNKDFLLFSTRRLNDTRSLSNNFWDFTSTFVGREDSLYTFELDYNTYRQRGANNEILRTYSVSMPFAFSYTFTPDRGFVAWSYGNVVPVEGNENRLVINEVTVLGNIRFIPANSD